jgi:hypothetical protein
VKIDEKQKDTRFIPMQGNTLEVIERGAQKLTGENLKVVLGRVFNFKLGYFVMQAIAQYMQACPSIELKTRPRPCSDSLSLSMYRVNRGATTLSIMTLSITTFSITTLSK